ncbi:hypothetical protein HMPREF1348_00920 [Enterococcus faecium 505]|uniref:Uncharacterized protein n=1 Tax=Enterococcus faecium 505 TaxID=1134806 RepID=J6YZS2_ENTFC|nr:hypothetical protein HMPREF1348_00920 [Enterococcus faecium 505]
MFDRTLKKRLGQKRLTPRNKKKFTKIAFQIFREFQLISEGVASASAVYTCLERETKVFFTFVSRSFKLFRSTKLMK